MLKWTNPQKLGDDYYFTFKPPTDGEKLSPLEAAFYTIEYITKNYPAPYTLYLSGGADSQAMLYAWHKSGVPYKTFSAVYNESLNEHDLCTLREFSAQYDITIDYHDFDLISFLENEHDYYANEYYCGSPHVTTFMKIADLTTEGTVIFAGQYIMNNKNQGRLGIPDRNNFSLYHYGIKSNKNIVPFFFLETRELAYAFDMQVPEIEAVHSPGSYADKIKGFQYYGFPVIGQFDNLSGYNELKFRYKYEDQVMYKNAKSKLNGFEKIKIIYDTNPPRQPTVQEKISRTLDQRSNRNFDLLYRNKYEAKFLKYKYIIV
jgi:hypothetical protein